MSRLVLDADWTPHVHCVRPAVCTSHSCYVSLALSIHHTAVTLLRLDVYTPHNYYISSSLSIKLLRQSVLLSTHHKDTKLVYFYVYTPHNYYVSSSSCLYITQPLCQSVFLSVHSTCISLAHVSPTLAILSTMLCVLNYPFMILGLPDEAKAASSDIQLMVCC